MALSSAQLEALVTDCTETPLEGVWETAVADFAHCAGSIRKKRKAVGTGHTFVGEVVPIDAILH